MYCTMGQTAENVAKQFNIARADQDAFALRSHQRARQAIERGRFIDEIIPALVKEIRYEAGHAKTAETLFEIDQGPRRNTSLEALAKLKPVFHLQGSVTAGNASSNV